MARVPASQDRAAAERRVMPRLAGSPPLAVSGIHATVHDVSRTGISFQMYEPIQAGEQRRLTLIDQLDASLEEFDAEAVWSFNGRAGFRWQDLTPEQDLWLRRRFQGWLAAGDEARPS